MRNWENNNSNMRKFTDNFRNEGRRGGRGSRGGNGGHGGGRGNGKRFRNVQEQRFSGFRNGQDGRNINNSFKEKITSDNQVFNEFKGINDITYAYEIKSKSENVLPPEPSKTYFSSPPSHFDASNESQTNIESKVTPPQQEEPKTPVAPVQKEQNLGIKSIKTEKASSIVEPQKVKAEPKQQPADTSSSGEESSSTESSSSEEEVPAMPKPMKSTAKPKKECEAEDEVICLGKRSNFENLVDDDDVKHCKVCKSEEHTSGKCQMNCIKCKHSSYSTHVICNNCGETYPPKPPAPNAPNPFLMFMQFMQFCMSQYTGMNNEITSMVPQPIKKEFENTKKNIADTKSHHKKSKSEAKQIRKKKKKSETSPDSDSESSPKATAPVRKRKKSESTQPSPLEVKPTHQSKQIRKKKKSESSTDSDSDSSRKATPSVKKRKKTDGVQPMPPVEQPIRKKKKLEISTTDSDSSTKTSASVKKRNKPDVQPTPPVKQPQQSRKKRKSISSTDSDSDSSSKATVAVKKRKNKDTEQEKPQLLPQFPAAFPSSMPFAGAFSNTGYNPMLAFSQMMGFNPKTMNFPPQ